MVELSEVKHVCHQGWWVGVLLLAESPREVSLPGLGCGGPPRPAVSFSEEPEKAVKAAKGLHQSLGLEGFF